MSTKQFLHTWAENVTNKSMSLLAGKMRNWKRIQTVTAYQIYHLLQVTI